MKKIVLIMAIVLVALAVVSLLLSGFYYFIGGATKDASNEFYHRVNVRTQVFLWCGIGLMIVGAVMFVIRFLFMK